MTSKLTMLILEFEIIKCKPARDKDGFYDEEFVEFIIHYYQKIKELNDVHTNR
jgi:hypothetical protein